MAQAALGNEALVLLIVLQKRDVITGALFNVQCASVILKVKVKSKVVAETVTLLFSGTYHVSKFSHAQAVRLDALISQDVVHQHQPAVVEPDLLALSFLCWRAIGPFCQSKREIIRK